MTQKVQTTEEVMQEHYWTPSDKKDHKTIYSTELLVENCNETEMVSCGPGVEKISEEIQTIFPSGIVENISSDTVKNFSKN